MGVNYIHSAEWNATVRWLAISLSGCELAYDSRNMQWYSKVIRATLA